MVVGMLLVDDVESIPLLAIAWLLQAPNPRVNGEEEQDVIIPQKCEICSNTNNVANPCSENNESVDEILSQLLSHMRFKTLIRQSLLISCDYETAICHVLEHPNIDIIRTNSPSFLSPKSWSSMSVKLVSSQINLRSNKIHHPR